MSNTAGKLGSEREETADPVSKYAVWTRELDAATKHRRTFNEISEKIQKRYRDERKDEDQQQGALAGQRINVFWSNTQVLKSTLYTKPPKVDVTRIFRDYGDDVARVAGVIMERLLNHDLEKDSADFDVAARQSIDDWLIVGEGQVWYRYEVETEEVEAPPALDPLTGQPLPVVGEPQMTERIVDENALSDYVYWRDFLCSPARTWAEVRWVARRVYMSADALEDRFGEEIAEDVPLYSRSMSGDKTSQEEATDDDPWATAEVWEIWCKTNKTVYWMVKGMDKFLDQRPDPLKIEGFFPCPEPLLANKTNNTLIPRADFSMARDQYRQIDIVATRLRLLVDACKVRGAYDKEAAPELANILSGNENKMIPVDNWAMFGEKGGLKGVLDWVPIEQVVAVISALRVEMAAQKQELYEVLGIADIMRGASRATETATAQQIKAQFGSTRLQFKQFEVGRFVRDAQRIKACIISAHYQPETIKERSNIMNTPDAQYADQAIALLKDKGVMQYRLVIQPDSMAALDWAQERQARTEFLQAIGGYVTAMMPLAQAKPETIPMILQLMQWGLAGFKMGKDIEGVLDQAIQQMSSQPQGPSPEQQATQKAELDKTQSETMKNVATAEKTQSETVGNRVQNASDAQVMAAMGAQQPIVGTPNEETYTPQPPGVM